MKDKVFEIEGYVKNEGRDAFFKLQRSFPPGGKVTFAQAYATLGKKSGVDGREFLKWLRATHFSDSCWVFYNDKGELYFAADKKAELSKPVGVGEASPMAEAGKGAGKALRRTSQATRKKGVEITAETMIEAEITVAKGLIDACTSRRELKKALTLSKQISHKEDHMRHLHGRLQQV